jgi:hypothetical protein
MCRDTAIGEALFMGDFLKSVLTGRDNLTWDVGRVLLFFGGLVFLGCTVLSVVKTMQFDMEKFGYGLGALLGGGGVGIGAKAHAEPGAGEGDDNPR